MDGEHQECGHKFPRVHPFLHILPAEALGPILDNLSRDIR